MKIIFLRYQIKVLNFLEYKISLRFLINKHLNDKYLSEKDNIMPDENQLESSENTIKEDETISWSKKAKNKSYVLHIKFDYNLKDYIFVFCLLMTSSINYNILYFPYIILGLILSYFLENKKIYRVKRKLEIFVMFYSILLLLLKIIVLFLNKNNKYNSFIQDNKILIFI